MSPFENRFNKFLATGEYVATEDARPKKTPKYLSIAEHDARFHPNGYNPDTDTCEFRAKLDAGNKSDEALSNAEFAESNRKMKEMEDKAVKFIHDSGLDVIDRNTRPNRKDMRQKIDVVAYDKDTDEIVFTMLRAHDSPATAKPPTRNQKEALSLAAGAWRKGQKWQGKYRYDIVDMYRNGSMDHTKNVFDPSFVAPEVIHKSAAEDARPKGWKPDPEKFLSQHDKRFHPNGFNPETDTCTCREQLDKTNNIDDLSAAEKMESNEKEGKDARPKGVPSDANWDETQRRYREQPHDADGKPDGEWKVWDEEGNLVQKAFFKHGKPVGTHETLSSTGKVTARIKFNDNGEKIGQETFNSSVEMKNTPASKAFEPRFDMNKQGLYGYGETDSDAKDAAKLAAAFNQRAGWGFADDEVQAYFDAFKDMDAGKVPKLPDLDGKTYEPPMDTKWNGPQQALAAIFQKRPDLIRPYIVERLEDANFHSEVKELRSGDYKKRTKPYDSQKEDEERQRRQMAQDAAAVKYLKEC